MSTHVVLETEAELTVAPTLLEFLELPVVAMLLIIQVVANSCDLFLAFTLQSLKRVKSCQLPDV